eukprot:364556-Chlamydomonas_euryale.AAC.4
MTEDCQGTWPTGTERHKTFLAGLPCVPWAAAPAAGHTSGDLDPGVRSITQGPRASVARQN